MFRSKKILIAALAATLALSGCAATAETEPTDDSRGGTLTIGSVGAPATLDPAGATWGSRAPYLQAVFDTLLLATPEGTIEPWLATEWSYNDDNTELTLSIRNDVTFTDGTALTADVVVQNLQRFKDGTSPNAAYLSGVASLAAPDATTVVITLAEPNPALLNYLTRDAGLVGSPENFDNPNIATDPIGSGPYVLDPAATVTGTSYSFTANPDYWNPDAQHYDALTINVFSDPTSALNAIKAGEANGMKIASNDYLTEVEAAGWTVNTHQLEFEGMLLFDRDGALAPELADVRVRQAINYAFDREALLSALQSDHGTPTTQVFPESSPAFDPALDERYSYDPKKAKKLLADAGYPDGFTMAMPSTSLVAPATWTLLGQQLADIGITVQFTDPGNNFVADMLAPKYPAALMILEQNPDWQLIQFMISPTATFNPFDSADPKVDEFLAEIQAGDEETRAAAAKELNEYIVEQAWFAPWFRLQGAYATDANTTVEMLPTNSYPAIYDFAPVD
jgi:peptide/nickel transport system substrate-binding protein